MHGPACPGGADLSHELGHGGERRALLSSLQIETQPRCNSPCYCRRMDSGEYGLSLVEPRRGKHLKNNSFGEPGKLNFQYPSPEAPSVQPIAPPSMWLGGSATGCTGGGIRPPPAETGGKR
jgi:hypothetical protein